MKKMYNINNKERNTTFQFVLYLEKKILGRTHFLMGTQWNKVCEKFRQNS